MKSLKTIFGEKSWLIAVLIVILPFAFSILYVMPCKGDYLMAAYIHGSKNLFADSIKATNVFYNGWNGMWPYLFLEYFLNPLNFAKAYSNLAGIELLLFFTLFVITLYFYLKEILSFFFDITNLRIVRGLYLCVLIAFLNMDFYRQIFYWFVGCVAYLLSTVFLMLAQIYMMRYFGKRTIAEAAMLAFTGFIACFCYELGIFLGIFYLLCMYKKSYEQKPSNIKDMIPLFFMIAGGLISLLAPGNFVRYNGLNTHADFFGLLVIAFGNIVESLCNTITAPVMIIFVAFGIYIGHTYVKKDIVGPIPRVYTLILFLLASLFGILFPLAFGFPDGEVGSRIHFLINFVILIWTMLISINVGSCIYKTYPSASNLIGKGYIAVGLIMTVLIIFNLPSGNGKRYEYLPWIYTATNLKDIQNENRYYASILKEIYASPDKNVVITISEEITSSELLISPLAMTKDGEDLSECFCVVVEKESVRILK